LWFIIRRVPFPRRGVESAANKRTRR
jgi:hypothetical protein